MCKTCYTKNRGVQDALFFCVDGLAGFKEAIGTVYPEAQIQRYIIHNVAQKHGMPNYQREMHGVFRGDVQTVRRHIVGGTNRTLISVKTTSRLCRIGACRRLSAE